MNDYKDAIKNNQFYCVFKFSNYIYLKQIESRTVFLEVLCLPIYLIKISLIYQLCPLHLFGYY